VHRELRFHAHRLRSNAPPYSPRRDKPVPGDNIGVTSKTRDRPQGLSTRRAWSRSSRMCGPPCRPPTCVLVDGTFWTDDEMIALGISKKYARDMGHLPQIRPERHDGVAGPLPATTRKILIHINNTNPILDEEEPQRARTRIARHRGCPRRHGHHGT
jgi:pyrroloquinoline quinone biosynthesis protein B